MVIIKITAFISKAHLPDSKLGTDTSRKEGGTFLSVKTTPTMFFSFFLNG